MLRLLKRQQQREMESDEEEKGFKRRSARKPSTFSFKAPSGYVASKQRRKSPYQKKVRAKVPSGDSSQVNCNGFTYTIKLDNTLQDLQGGKRQTSPTRPSKDTKEDLKQEATVGLMQDSLQQATVQVDYEPHERADIVDPIPTKYPNVGYHRKRPTLLRLDSVLAPEVKGSDGVDQAKAEGDPDAQARAPSPPQVQTSPTSKGDNAPKEPICEVKDIPFAFPNLAKLPELPDILLNGEDLLVAPSPRAEKSHVPLTPEVVVVPRILPSPPASPDTEEDCSSVDTIQVISSDEESEDDFILVKPKAKWIKRTENSPAKSLSPPTLEDEDSEPEFSPFVEELAESKKEPKPFGLSCKNQ